MKPIIKRMASLFLTAVLLLSLLPLAAAGDTGTVWQKPYFRKGLVAWYDGGNNANGSHDLQSDLWKDLSGNTYHLDVSDGVDRNTFRWEHNGAVVDPEKGHYQRLSYSALGEIEEHSYTMELVFGDLTWEDTATPSLLYSTNGDFSLTASRAEDGAVNLFYQNGKSEDGSLAVQGRVDDLDNTTIALVFIFDDKEKTNTFLYADGEQVAGGYTKELKELQYVYFGHADQSKRWGGEIHGIRIYNRALTSEELTANAEADSFNYREGNIIEPVERYDPNLDIPSCIPPKLDCVDSNDRIPFNDQTDMIPMMGYYGAINLFDYLYPYGDEPVVWEGARLTRAEEVETFLGGGEDQTVRFVILYESVCVRARKKPIPYEQTRYAVFSYKAEGTIDEMRVKTEAYNSKKYEDEVSFGTLLNQTPITGDGTEDTRYLVYEFGELSDETNGLSRLDVEIDGLEGEEALYLLELSFFATAEEVMNYTGLSITDTESATDPDIEPTPDTDEETEPDGSSDVTTSDVTTSDVTTPDIPSDTDTGPDKSDGGGCTSSVGLGAAAMLIAVAAAMALKKQKNE